MQGVDFTISGQVKWLTDYPPRQYGGQIAVLVEIGLQTFNGINIGAHAVFASINYGQKDPGQRFFDAFKKSLDKGCYVLLRGAVKPKAHDKTCTLPATAPRGAQGCQCKKPTECYQLDCNWRSVMVSKSPIRPINRVTVEAEVVGLQQYGLQAKYRYQNPKEPDPQKKWKERLYAFAYRPGADAYASMTVKQPRDSFYGEGFFFGVHPQDPKQKMTWMGLEFIA